MNCALIGTSNMVHLKRFLWLFAWSVWLWLGFGLFRELPRELGPVVCRLGQEEVGKVLGFVGQSDLVATIKQHGGRTSMVEVFDAVDGRRLYSVPAPLWNDSIHRSAVPRGLAGGFLLALSLWDEKKARFSVTGLHVLNLRTGTWKTLTNVRVDRVSIHPTKPLVAYLDHTWPTSVVVMNIQTGERLFEHKLPTRFALDAPVFFMGDDRIVFPLQAVWFRDAEDAAKFEIYRIGHSKQPVKTVHGPRFFRLAASSTGRVALMKETDLTVEVLDLERETIVFSEPRPEPSAILVTKRTSAPAISPSGRTVMSGRNQVLWEIDRGVALWRPGEWELAHSAGTTNDFVVSENWSGLWSKFAPKFKFETFARRNLESGQVLLRTPRDYLIAPHICNAAGTLVVLGPHVHHLPLRVNYPLFLICQSILALPLILLWTLLRFRRRRAARRQAAVAPPTTVQP
jgi:hypothetical protein